MGRTQPTRDEAFIAWALNLAARCTERQEEWGLNPASVQKLNTLMKTAETAYWNNLNLETRNRKSVALKKGGIAALRSFLSAFILALRANEAIGEDDLEALGLPSRKHHNRLPLPAPTEAPKVSVVTKTGHEIRVYVSVMNYGHATASLTKKSYHGFVVRYRKEDCEEWHSGYSTRLHTDLFFNGEDSGKRLILMAA
ncbi:MAG: hypothetical protein LBD52_02770, partial [Prevotellaceae bacterium]|nr:hypothetical protein [Prevotellaceae bacterium]